MKGWRKLPLALLAFFLTGGAQVPHGQTAPYRDLPAPYEDWLACEREHGEMQRVGSRQNYLCVTRYSDAGNTCQNSSECQGSCVAVSAARPGRKVAGVCSADTNVFGCHTFVVDGRAQPRLCLD